MNQRNMLSFPLLTALGLSLLPSHAIAQQKSLKEQLVGTWTMVLCEAVHPDGTRGPLVMGSDPAGHLFVVDYHPKVRLILQ
jgi:hypothetical protein